MSTPVATIADALIAFILSLLRDPSAVEEFAAAPKAMLANNGLDDACAADVRAVKPVIVDHASVAARTVQPQQQYPPGTQFDNDPDPTDPVSEITRILNQFTSIDARTTIVDQSTNQNIWTEGGDVTQIFDQDAVVASGDDAVAAGEDANLIDTDLDVTVGDVSVGNTDIEGSFNETDTDGEESDPLADEALVAVDAPAESESSDAAEAAGDAVATAIGAATDAAGEALTVPVSEPVGEPVIEAPADVLATDMAATDTTYESDAAASAVAAEEPLFEEPAEDQ